MKTKSDKRFGQICREAAQLIWPWTKDRAFGMMKAASKKLKGRTKLTFTVEVAGE